MVLKRLWIIKKVIFFGAYELWVIYFCAFGLRLGHILRLWATPLFFFK